MRRRDSVLLALAYSALGNELELSFGMRSGIDTRVQGSVA